jgi:hypothetical protein
MPTNKERNPNQGSNQNPNSLNQQNEKKHGSSNDDRSSGKSGMSSGDSQHKASPSRDKDQGR